MTRDQRGVRLASLGVHEHWNHPVDKRYSRNLGLNQGIELVAQNVSRPGAGPSPAQQRPAYLRRLLQPELSSI
jgi:hypothetical protein